MNFLRRFIKWLFDVFKIGHRVNRLTYDFKEFKRQYGIELRKQNAILFIKNIAYSANYKLIESSDRKRRIIVSLTTYGGRIDYVHLVIESIGLQTLKADRIILWLDKDEFSPETIPITLKHLEDRGLEIGYCENVMSYMKIIPTLKKYPDDLIITVDDDIIYSEYMIEKLYKAYSKEPDVIHCHRGHKIRFSLNGEILPYRKWDRDCFDFDKSLNIFPAGVGGVLYFPGCFSNEITDSSLFLKLCPTADDVWFKTMSLVKGVKCRVVNRTRLWKEDNIDISSSLDKGLYEINRYKNDEQIINAFDYFNVMSYLNKK